MQALARRARDLEVITDRQYRYSNLVIRATNDLETFRASFKQELEKY